MGYGFEFETGSCGIEHLLSPVKIGAICPLGITESGMTDLSKVDMQQLTDYISQSTAGSIAHGSGMAELNRRQYIATLEATGVQKAAADVARRNATYMLWSVIVAAIAAVFSAISALATAYSVWPKK
jgi:hypothetical protein